MWLAKKSFFPPTPENPLTTQGHESLWASQCLWGNTGDPPFMTWSQVHPASSPMPWPHHAPSHLPDLCPLVWNTLLCAETIILQDLAQAHLSRMSLLCVPKATSTRVFVLSIALISFCATGPSTSCLSLYPWPSAHSGPQ